MDKSQVEAALATGYGTDILAPRTVGGPTSFARTPSALSQSAFGQRSLGKLQDFTSRMKTGRQIADAGGGSFNKGLQSLTGGIKGMFETNKPGEYGLVNKHADGSMTMTPGGQVAMAGVSAVLGGIADNMAIKDAESAALENMRSEFDRMFTDIEHTRTLRRVQQEAEATANIIASVNAMLKENDVSAQTLAAQRQVFIRDPQSGALL